MKRFGTLIAAALMSSMAFVPNWSTEKAAAVQQLPVRRTQRSSLFGRSLGGKQKRYSMPFGGSVARDKRSASKARNQSRNKAARRG